MSTSERGVKLKNANRLRSAKSIRAIERSAELAVPIKNKLGGKLKRLAREGENHRAIAIFEQQDQFSKDAGKVGSVNLVKD